MAQNQKDKPKTPSSTTITTTTTTTTTTDLTSIPSLQEKEHEIQYLSTLLPNDSTSSSSTIVTKKRNRPLNKTTVRNMLTWSHYKFFTRLQNKLGQSRLLECTEEYTTKTCGNCGKLHNNIGSSKVFKCPNCEYEADRDHNAARNIMLKVFTELQFCPPEPCLNMSP
jgi:hypothetical protein